MWAFFSHSWERLFSKNIRHFWDLEVKLDGILSNFARTTIPLSLKGDPLDPIEKWQKHKFGTEIISTVFNFLNFFQRILEGIYHEIG